jgi:hypothetical protein
MLRLLSAGTLICVVLTGCGSTSSAGNEGSAVSPETPKRAIEPGPETRANFDENEGDIYHYATAVSDEDKAKGRAVGEVISFRYLGVQSGKHVLENVNPDGRVLGRADCAAPCRIIVRRYGQLTDRLPFDPSSVIGAAFEDAISGHLVAVRKDKPAESSDTGVGQWVYSESNDAGNDAEATGERGEKARCRLTVQGTNYIDGACWVRLETGGSFQIMSLDGTYFAQLHNSNGSGQGYWNESPNATHAHTDLGAMTRSGGCWANESAEICAWR